MSERLHQFLGYVIKVRCKGTVYEGEIVSVDGDTVVLSKVSEDGRLVSTTFLGINQVLIQGMDIISPPNNFDTSQKSQSIEINKTLNVYTSATQPPIIKRGGPSSAVHRNLLRTNNIQEKIHKSQSSNFPDSSLRNGISNSGNISCEPLKKDVNRSRNSSFNDNTRNRKCSTGNIIKEPSWMNYPINPDTDSFDFDSNLALFNKNSLYSRSYTKKSITEVYSDSSDSGGINMSFGTRNGFKTNKSNTINIEPKDFSLYNDEKTFIDFKKSTKKKDVFSELLQMGIIPTPKSNVFKENLRQTSDKESQQLSNDLLKNRCFLQQPDIIQEVTKSQLCNSDALLTEHSTILSINKKSIDFQNFAEFWIVDDDFKFPVFSIKQRDKLFECANKFGYDVRTIAEQIGKTISEFVIHQSENVTKLNGFNVSKISKIAVFLSRCQTSVFVAAIARYLVNEGCKVLVFYDDTAQINEDVEMEIKLLDSTLRKFGRINGFNNLSMDFKDFEDKSFDYIINGLECETNFKSPCEDIIKWCFKQKTTILTLNPNNFSHIPWKTAIFVGVPTSSYKNLQIRTPYACDHGFFKPRCDGIVGLEIDKMFKKPDGLILLCNVNLPMEVFNLLNLKYKSPFNSKNWIRLYTEHDLSLVE